MNLKKIILNIYKMYFGTEKTEIANLDRTLEWAMFAFIFSGAALYLSIEANKLFNADELLSKTLELLVIGIVCFIILVKRRLDES